MSTSPYDVTVKNSAGTTFGYVIDWENERPLTKSSKPAEIGSAAQIADQNSRYNVRDANDYLRMDIYDWAEGAGQKSYDTPGSNAAKFYDSRNIDISERGELKLGPGVSTSADANSAAGAKCIAALGAIFYSRTPAGSDPRGTIGYLTTTSLVGGTPVLFDGTDPTGSVAAFATDGQYVYAAMGADGVWKGTASGSVAWTQLSADAANRNIVALAYCGGTLYGAKGSDAAACQVGYFNSSGIWTEITGMTFAYQTPVALATLGNYAYMVTYAGGVSKVYTVQHNDGAGTNVVIDLATFPTGFRATCAYGYLGNLYVGGYYETATASVGIGAIYLINGNSMALLTTIGEDATEDWRIMSITGHMKHLYFLANNSVYKWSLELGGYHHYFDVSTPGAGFTWTVTEAMTAEPSTGWTAAGTATVASADGITTWVVASGSSKTYTRAPSLVSSTGHCVELTLGGNFGASGLVTRGPIYNNSPTWTTTAYTYESDGSYITYMVVEQRQSTYAVETRIGLYNSSDVIVYGSVVDSTSLANSTIRVQHKGGYASVYLDDALAVGPVLCKSSAAADSLVFGVAGSTAAERGVKLDVLRYSVAGDNPLRATTPTATIVHGLGELFVQSGATGYAITISGTTVAPSGWLDISESCARMAGVDKYYKAIDVGHETLVGLPSSCSISVGAWVDGVYGGTDCGAALATNADAYEYHTWDIDSSGRTIKARLVLTGGSGQTPVVRSLVTRFLPEATPTLWTFIFRCVNGVPMHNGREWDYDAWDAIAHLYNAVNSVCTVETLYGDSITGHIESVDFLASYPSKAVGQGLVQVTLRELS